MTGLNWKSDDDAAVIHRYQKGTGDPPKRQSGVEISKSPEREIAPGFFVIPSEVEESRDITFGDATGSLDSARDDGI